MMEESKVVKFIFRSDRILPLQRFKRSLNEDFIDFFLFECKAKELLDKYHTVKKVIFASFTNETDNSVIDECLNKEHGNIRKAIKFYKENK